MEAKIEIRGAKELGAKLDHLARFAVSNQLRGAMEDGKDALVILAKRDAPKKSYQLWGSIHGVVADWGTPNPKIIVGSWAKYAPAIEEGSQPHTIVPRQRRFLQWFVDAGGQTVNMVHGFRMTSKQRAAIHPVFAKAVNHPGFPAKPFLGPNVQRVHVRLVKAIQRLMNEHLRQG